MYAIGIRSNACHDLNFVGSNLFDCDLIELNNFVSSTFSFYFGEEVLLFDLLPNSSSKGSFFNVKFGLL
jgi:hypothetical protein